MPFIIPTKARIAHLINNYDNGAFYEAQITEKSNVYPYYKTELDDIGPSYIMDDFGNGILVEIEMFVQRMFIMPPLAALT